MPYSIAIFSAYYAPHIGGVERYTRSLAEELAQQGCSVTIVTSRAEAADIELSERIRLLAIPSLSLMGDRFPLPKPSKKTLSAIRRITHSRFDAVIVNTRYYPISILGCIAAKNNESKPVVVDHSSGYLSRPNSVSGIAIRAWEQLATRIIKCFSPDFYGVSQGSVSWLKKLGIEARGVIPNSIDASEYKQQRSSRQWRRELDIDEATCLVAYVSRLVPEKGVLPLIDAIRHLPHACDVALTIAGDGPLRKTVEDAAAKANRGNIHYIGPLLPEDTSSLLYESDVFCLPTLYPEGLPTVLLEAAVQKNAIIVSNCAGAKDVIPDGNHGTILECTSEKAIGEAIEAYVHSIPGRAEAANNASEHVCKRFSWKKTAVVALEACRQANKR